MKIYEEVNNNPYHIRFLNTDSIREVIYDKTLARMTVVFKDNKCALFVRVHEIIFQNWKECSNVDQYYQDYIRNGNKNTLNEEVGYMMYD